MTQPPRRPSLTKDPMEMVCAKEQLALPILQSECWDRVARMPFGHCSFCAHVFLCVRVFGEGAYAWSPKVDIRCVTRCSPLYFLRQGLLINRISWMASEL